MLRSIAPDLGFTRDRALQKAQDARGRLLERPPLCCDASRSMRASIAFQSHLTMSNSPDLLVPAAHVCARVLHRCFTHPESRGGRSADPPPLHPHVASGCPRLLQRLGSLLLRPPHAASTILRGTSLRTWIELWVDHARLEQAFRLLRPKRSP